MLLDVTDDMAIAQEEIFGPAAPILVFDTEEEVIRRANATTYGLAAYFYTRDMTRLVRVAEQLEYGLVGAFAGVLGLSTGPCSVVGCGAPVLPVAGLVFAGLSSGTLALLSGAGEVRRRQPELTHQSTCHVGRRKDHASLRVLL